VEVPKVGDIVYIETELYVWHGADDFRSSKATVSAVKMEMCRSGLVPFIGVAEQPGTSHT
jgi:hypothetical protein